MYCVVTSILPDSLGFVFKLRFVDQTVLTIWHHRILTN